MKKITSIYMIFVIYLVMVLAGFIVLYRYSTTSLREALMSVAKMQMDYSDVLLDQKIREIEIEADGILNSGNLRNMQMTMTEKYDAYRYVMGVRELKEYLNTRQKTNVGMAEFILYWPGSGRVLSTSTVLSVKEEVLEQAEDNAWFEYDREIYFSRKYRTGWNLRDDEPYLIIRMERDFLYKIKNMALDVENGGSFLMLPDGRSVFSVNDREAAILNEIQEEARGGAYELSVGREQYQMLMSETTKSGLQLVGYYPMREMLSPVRYVTVITLGVLFLLLTVGLLLLILYYKNILLQLRIITEKLHQVEEGDLSARLVTLPHNEFAYVFQQFNTMVEKIRDLIQTTLKEQQLRSQAELRQLQLQINPHFLYNSLSYIVTVADNPGAVTRMAVHLSKYYRYCTRTIVMGTVGQEIAYAEAYLTIMSMRKSIVYSITIPEEFHELKMLPLVLQPIIENAVEHGIEGRENAKRIFIRAFSLPDGVIQFEISDDGEGMEEKDMERLARHIRKKERDENESVGLWNVHQRLINYYGEAAGLLFKRSVWGGLLVSFQIMPGGEGRK